jgi:hypothetical protein
VEVAQGVLEEAPLAHHRDRRRRGIAGGARGRRAGDVAQGTQALDHLRRRRGLGARHGPGGEGGGARSHRVDDRRVLGGDFVPLPRVPGEVVELGTRRAADVLPAPIDERAQRAAARRFRVPRLRVDLVRRGPAACPEEVASSVGGWHSEPEQTDHGGEDVDQAHELVARGGRQAGGGQDQRLAQGRLVEQHAVGGLAVLAEASP